MFDSSCCRPVDCIVGPIPLVNEVPVRLCALSRKQRDVFSPLILEDLICVRALLIEHLVLLLSLSVA